MRPHHQERRGLISINMSDHYMRDEPSAWRFSVQVVSDLGSKASFVLWQDAIENLEEDEAILTVVSYRLYDVLQADPSCRLLATGQLAADVAPADLYA